MFLTYNGYSNSKPSKNTFYLSNDSLLSINAFISEFSIKGFKHVIYWLSCLYVILEYEKHFKYTGLLVFTMKIYASQSVFIRRIKRNREKRRRKENDGK